MTLPTSRRVEIVCILAGVGGVVTVGVAAALSRQPLHNGGELAFFLVAMCVVHLLPLRVWHNGEAENIQLDEAMFVPMALMLNPLALVGVIGVSMAFASVVSRRGPQKTVFNAGQGLVAAGIGVAATRALGGTVVTRPTVGPVVAAIVGGLIFTAVSAMAVSGVISIAQQRS